jgi:hypothetical protein
MELVELRKKKRKKKLIYLYSDSYRSVENTIKKKSIAHLLHFLAFLLLLFCVFSHLESLPTDMNWLHVEIIYFDPLHSSPCYVEKFHICINMREKEKYTHSGWAKWVSEWVREEKEMKNNCKHNEWNTNKLNKHEFNIDIRWCAWWFPPLCVLLYMAEKKEHRVRDR